MKLICLDFVIMHGSRRGGGSGPPENYKAIGFLSNTGLDPIKIKSYLNTIQCWAIIDRPAKRHLEVLHFLWYLDTLTPLSKLSGSVHDNVCFCLFYILSNMLLMMTGSNRA